MKALLLNSCLLLLISTSPVVASHESGAEATAPGEAPFTGQDLPDSHLPKGLSPVDWSSIRAQIAAHKHRAHEQADGSFAAANPAHGWTVHYGNDGTTRLQPRDREAISYELAFRLESLGYTEPQPLDQPQHLSSHGTTVTYQWTDNLREWWTNSEDGLEQWFELEQRPAGASDGQPLRLQLTLAGDLSPSQSGDTLTFSGANGTEITYSKLFAWDATGRELQARMLLTENRLNLLIEDQDARYPLTIDPTLEQQAFLMASNAQTGDQFGQTIDLDLDTLVVGAYNEDGPDDGTQNNSGAAYVFARSGMVWAQQAYLRASNAGAGDAFGISVAVDGDTVVVGARGEDSNGGEGNNTVTDSGAAYVFTRSGSVWTQQAYIKASNPGTGLIGDQFGHSIDISSDTLVVGAPGEASNATGVNGDQNDNSMLTAGAAYVFTRSGTTWTQQAYLKASNTFGTAFGGGDNFGQAVAVSGDIVAVGAHLEDSSATGIGGSQADGADASGAVYVFNRSGSTWSQQAYVKASNTGADDEFGFALSLDGETLLVGARGEGSIATGVGGNKADDSAPAAGAAYVFFRNAGNWSEQAYLKASNTQGGDRFGNAVDVNGNTAIVGATNEDGPDNGTQENSGAAYVFVRSGGVWSQHQQPYFKASNAASNDNFGSAVAVSGETLAVGARSKSGGGAAYVFDYPRRVLVITQ